MDSQWDKSRREPWRGRSLFWNGRGGARSGLARLARDRGFALSEIRDRVRLGAGDGMGEADSRRLARQTNRARSLLLCEPAEPAAGRNAAGSRLVRARSESPAPQLPARGRKRSLFRRRLSAPSPNAGRGRGRLFRRTNRSDRRAAAVTKYAGTSTVL